MSGGTYLEAEGGIGQGRVACPPKHLVAQDGGAGFVVLHLWMYFASERCMWRRTHQANAPGA